jgi:tRNA pseudouridine13 synthase
MHWGIHTPLLTSDLPGIGGQIKESIDDFEVEEIPAYELSGSGEHLYLWIEKRDLGGEYFQRQVAKRLGIPSNFVGMAGLKDRRAVTRQWLSVPMECEPRLSDLDSPEIRILKTSRHDNKLKPGHLRGNRFKIKVRDVDPVNQALIHPIVDRIKQFGLPNYYGPQRFGHDGETAILGLQHLQGQRKRVSPFLLKLYLSAAQSLFFNLWVARRLQDDMLRTVLSGDVMMKWPFGGMFNAVDIPTEQGRLERGEIVLGGPMFGKKTFAAKEVALERELALLQESGYSLSSFRTTGKMLEGTRRHSLIYINDLQATWETDCVTMEFTLPSGCYATVLLREIMKNDQVLDEVAVED